jgi:hypothetical protein
VPEWCSGDIQNNKGKKAKGKKAKRHEGIKAKRHKV